uniref:N-alpha-acetyltransferase 60 n=1 Tax=Ditylenchus dipsaci TaxID=166011 RepID=A0A915EQD9_9BILA
MTSARVFQPRRGVGPHIAHCVRKGGTPLLHLQIMPIDRPDLDIQFLNNCLTQLNNCLAQINTRKIYKLARDQGDGAQCSDTDAGPVALLALEVLLVPLSELSMSVYDAALTRSHGDYPITFRLLSAEDIPETMSLCKQSFPKEYTEEYFVYACANPDEFFLLGCFDNDGSMLGFLLAIYDIETSEWYDPEMPVVEEQLIKENGFRMAYVCLIAVQKAREGGGLGSFLMQQFSYSLKKCSPPPCAIYLHVLSENQRAIDFYKNINFQVYCHLPNYYHYNGQHHDALILVQSFGYPMKEVSQLNYENQPAILLLAQNTNAAVSRKHGEQPRKDQKQRCPSRSKCCIIYNPFFVCGE